MIEKVFGAGLNTQTSIDSYSGINSLHGRVFGSVVQGDFDVHVDGHSLVERLFGDDATNPFHTSYDGVGNMHETTFWCFRSFLV